LLPYLIIFLLRLFCHLLKLFVDPLNDLHRLGHFLLELSPRIFTFAPGLGIISIGNIPYMV